MSWFARARPQLSAAQQQALARWRAQTAPRLIEPLAEAALVVLDTETSGLDVRNDRLLSIGAVRVTAARIALAHTLHVNLKQPEASARTNILIHGIGASEQLNGQQPPEALIQFLDFIGALPLVAFHADFDRTMLEYALRQRLGIRLRARWLDLAPLLPMLYRDAGANGGLDDWLDYFNIQPAARHNALGDAEATAQLLLIALDRARRAGVRDTRGLFKLAAQRHWFAAPA